MKMVKRVTFPIALSVLTLITLSFNNCGQVGTSYKSWRSSNGEPIIQGTSTGNPGGSMTFDKVSQKVFQPYCVECHSEGNAMGDVRYDTYEAAISNGELDRLYRSYRDHVEPSSECGQISPDEMDIVANWIASGATE